MDKRFSAYRWLLKYLEIFVIRSLANPMFSRKLVETLQRVTMEQRAEERVKSKGQFVMNCIEVLPQSERMRAKRNYILNCRNASPSIRSDLTLACIFSNEFV